MAKTCWKAKSNILRSAFCIFVIYSRGRMTAKRSQQSWRRLNMWGAVQMIRSGDYWKSRAQGRGIKLTSIFIMNGDNLHYDEILVREPMSKWKSHARYSSSWQAEKLRERYMLLIRKSLAKLPVKTPKSPKRNLLWRLGRHHLHFDVARLCVFEREDWW